MRRARQWAGIARSEICERAQHIVRTPLTAERCSCYYFAHANDNQIWPAMRKTSRRRRFDSDLGQSGSLGEERRANALPSGRRKKVVDTRDGVRRDKYAG